MFPVERSSKLSEFDEGFVIGLLVGEGSFGGDGRQAQITLRMHTRHEQIFRWLELTFPAGRLYGPYLHGGRHYYQWMARGWFLADVMVPLFERHLDRLDPHVRGRFMKMCDRYRIGPHEEESPQTSVPTEPLPAPNSSPIAMSSSWDEILRRLR
jgi:hypothetical protein